MVKTKYIAGIVAGILAVYGAVSLCQNVYNSCRPKPKNEETYQVFVVDPFNKQKSNNNGLSIRRKSDGLVIFNAYYKIDDTDRASILTESKDSELTKILGGDVQLFVNYSLDEYAQKNR